MTIRPLMADESHRLLPLLHQVHALHVDHQPERYPPLQNNAETLDWLSGWLKGENMHCLVAEEGGSLSGYAIYEIEHRPAMPLRHAETRGMLHHIAVDHTHRRQGIGRALVQAVRARLNADGITILATTYASFNKASAQLIADAGLAPKMIYAEWRGLSCS